MEPVHPFPQPVDTAWFTHPGPGLPTRYGLPEQVAHCQKCVISNQRPSSTIEFHHTRDSLKQVIRFDDQGVCDACRIQEGKTHTDWTARESALRALCDQYRKTDGSYDCLVPGSGGKDSFYAAHVLKYRYGMHPLTVTWAPHLHTEWGWRNFQAWIHAGFDNLLMTPNGRVHRLLTRLAVENLFHPFQPFILGQKNLAPKMALQYGIPLIFYGENEAEYGNARQDSLAPRRDASFFTESNREQLCLGGVSVSDLVAWYGVESYELAAYLPVDPQAIAAQGVEVHYLGYYLPWHPQGNYYYAVENGGFEPSPERTPGTYSKYNSIDDRIDDFHYYTTYIKFGLGRASYDAAQEIRNDEITREEGVALVRKFDGEFPERFAEEIFRYLSLPDREFPVASRRFAQPIMDRDYFMRLADSFRSPHLWRWEAGRWRLRHTVFEGKSTAVPRLARTA